MPKIAPQIDLAGIKVSKDSNTPLFIKVYTLFREMILSKRLRSGDRLPSTRSLATQLGISRTIVTQSFEQLILEGYLIAKPGSGTYIATVLPDQLMTVEETVQSKKSSKKLVFVNEEIKSVPPNVLEFISNKEEIVPFIAGTGMPSFDLSL